MTSSIHIPPAGGSYSWTRIGPVAPKAMPSTVLCTSLENRRFAVRVMGWGAYRTRFDPQRRVVEAG
jgi:hypothetical protein